MAPGSLSEETVKRLRAPARGNSITYFAGATIQGAKAPRGFGVRVTASGARAFILNYRLRGREHRFTIGAWPDWTALRAVREARNLRQRVDRGEDPRKERAAIPATKSVSSVIDDFITSDTCGTRSHPFGVRLKFRAHSTGWSSRVSVRSVSTNFAALMW